MDKEVIIIGPLPNHRPESIGGTTKMFYLLVQYFTENKLPNTIIVSNRYKSSIVNLLFVLIKIISRNKAPIVMLNLSTNSLLLKTLPIYLLTRIFNQKLVLRVFGGDMKEKVEKMNSFSKFVLFKYVFQNTELILPETKRLMQHFRSAIKKAEFFPNIRKRNKEDYTTKTYNKRFCFLSQIKEEKGIDLILEAKEKLDDTYTIDLYGPILDNKYNYFHDEDFYKGSIPIDKVLSIIDGYDVILLPTHWQGEGYPGIIIEGYSLGKPVITTNWLAIPEIVENEKTGVLIDSKSADQLITAIQSFSKENYQKYSIGAYKKFDMFCADTVHGKIYKFMQQL